MTSLRKSASILTRCVTAAVAYLCAAFSLPEPAWASAQRANDTTHGVHAVRSDANLSELINQLSDSAIFDSFVSANQDGIAQRGMQPQQIASADVNRPVLQPQQTFDIFRENQPQQTFDIFTGKQPAAKTKTKEIAPK